MPDVPTIAESGADLGLASFDIHTWFGLFGLARLPPATTARLNKAFVDALASPELKSRLAALMAEPAPSTPEAFAQFVRAEHARYEKIVKASGARADRLAVVTASAFSLPLRMLADAAARLSKFRVGTDVAAGAGAVVDDDGAQTVLDLVGERARRHVQRPAGRVGHDQADRLGGLGPGRRRGGQRQEERPSSHRDSLG